jgi:hypothetical protein
MRQQAPTLTKRDEELIETTSRFSPEDAARPTGFFPTKTVWHDREVELVREGTEWKLDLALTGRAT